MKSVSLLISSIMFSPMVAFADEPVPHPLSFMFGEWVGPASGYTQTGPYSVTQTERVGPMLDGDIVVIEGRAYAESGESQFNAFAVLSKSAPDGGWEIRSHAQGRVGTFPFELTESGYVWSTPAGPNARMVYTATFDQDIWRQVGNYTPEAGPSRQVFEMTLTRVAETDWPSGGAVSPNPAE